MSQHKWTKWRFLKKSLDPPSFKPLYNLFNGSAIKETTQRRVGQDLTLWVWWKVFTWGKDTEAYTSFTPGIKMPFVVIGLQLVSTWSHESTGVNAPDGHWGWIVILSAKTPLKVVMEMHCFHIENNCKCQSTYSNSVVGNIYPSWSRAPLSSFIKLLELVTQQQKVVKLMNIKIHAQA